MKKCLSIGCVPEASYVPANGFLANVRSFKHHHDLILFSSRKDIQADIVIPAEAKTIIGDARYPNGQPNTWATNNLNFLTAVRIAVAKEYDYLMYLEADCRIAGDGWDGVIFDEFFNAGDGKLIGGTAVTYSACNRDREFTLRWRDFLVKNASSPFPIPNYGGVGSAQTAEPCVLVNGAFAIYDINFLKSIYKLTNTYQESIETTAFDYHIGRELVRKHGAQCFDFVAHLSSVYSGYGDVFFTEQERIKLLTDGKVVAVHQVKSNWTLKGGVAERSNVGTGVIALSAGQSQVGQNQSVAEPDRVAATGSAGSNPASPTNLETPDGGNRPVPSLPRASSGVETVEAANEAPTAKAGAAPAESGASSEVVNPRVSIFIVTHARDIAYLSHCLESIARFASGFHRTMVLFPQTDTMAFADVVKRFEPPHFLFAQFDQAPAPLGHLHQQLLKCCPDLHDEEANYFLHVDSDCIFTRPFSPADYFQDGKPVLCGKAWAKVKADGDNSYCWRRPVENALGYAGKFETMQRLPLLYPEWIYKELRALIEKRKKMDFAKYVLTRKADFPYDFCEFNTLGALALAKHPADFHFIDVGENPFPDNPMIQFWSHGPIDKPQDINNGGVQMKGVVPLDEFKKILSL